MTLELWSLKRIEEKIFLLLRLELQDMGLEAKLDVQQGDDSEIRQQVEDLRDLYSQNQKIITSRDETIKEKDEKIRKLEQQLSRFDENSVPLFQVGEEARVLFSALEELSYSDRIKTNFKSVDTVRVFSFGWYDSIPRRTVRQQDPKLRTWLKTRLQLDTLRVQN